MKITKKFTYALNILEQLGKNESVTAQFVASNCSLSKNFVTIIMRDLKNSNILSSKKGPGGGYFLSKELEEITVGEVFNSVNEDFKQSGLFVNESSSCKKFFDDFDNHILKISERPVASYF
jgi:Rrf2 family protein